MNLDVKKDSLSQLLFSYGSDESDSSSTENEFVGEKNYNKSRSVESATKNRETDDGDKEVEGRLMLPLPEGIVNMFKEDTEYEEDPCQHDGRVRTFPHFPGNWAMQVFIPFMASAEFENLVTSLTASLSAAIFLDVYKLSHKELHVSVSRTVPIRHYWIDPIVQQLREGLSSIHRFTCALQYPELYTNDEKTSFKILSEWWMAFLGNSLFLLSIRIHPFMLVLLGFLVMSFLKMQMIFKLTFRVFLKARSVRKKSPVR
ncbi:U6 snRNA phosphodiesterase 1-like isoform X3 [Montipora capricornis]|uniref:U6 snRNA phosphodiesterase 1-like isoform X3 n=1 Tax=Montipora capricornis TaxID=246305 RepID=UPI0035F1A9E7